VFNIFRWRFKKTGRWTGGTTIKQRLEVLKELSVNVERIDIDRQQLIRATRHLDPSKVYMITVTGHVMTFENGLLYDQQYQTGVAPVNCRSAKRFIKSIYEVVEGEI
jgi:hypothetical protein